MVPSFVQTKIRKEISKLANWNNVFKILTSKHISTHSIIVSGDVCVGSPLNM